MERYRYMTKMVMLRAIRLQAEAYVNMEYRAYDIYINSHDVSRGVHAAYLRSRFYKKAERLFLIEKLLTENWPEHDTLSVIRGLLE